MKNIIIFGAPGSGKGTYSDEIVTRRQWSTHSRRADD